MFKKVISLIMVMAIIAITVGCAAHIHTIGNGGSGSQTVEQRQWYVLWGLVPINQVDSQAMAAGAQDYTIKTEQSALDVIINIFTSAITVYSRTVTVTK
jgi:hypothetical protein